MNDLKVTLLPKGFIIESAPHSNSEDKWIYSYDNIRSMRLIDDNSMQIFSLSNTWFEIAKITNKENAKIAFDRLKQKWINYHLNPIDKQMTQIDEHLRKLTEMVEALVFAPGNNEYQEAKERFECAAECEAECLASCEAMCEASCVTSCESKSESLSTTNSPHETSQ